MEDQTNGSVGDVHAEMTPDEAPSAERTAPVAEAQRISALDSLRGLALLGILVMNIPFFAFSGAIWFSPPIAGGFEGLDYATWLGSHLAFDMKMMSIFAMLFGAGIVLFAERSVAKSGRAAGLYYRRMWWLLVIGMIHAYVFWEGDILVLYALCGMVLYPLRFLSARLLIPIGIVMISVVIGLNYGQGKAFEYMQSQSQERARLIEAGEPVPASVEGMAEAWDGTFDEETGELVEEGLSQGFYPEPEDLQKEADALRGSFVDRMAYRAPDVFFMQTFLFFMWGIWRSGGCMALGMALYKTGFLAGKSSTGAYLVSIVAGLGAGIPLILLGVQSNTASGFDTIHQFQVGMSYNYAGSMGVAFAWVGLIMLLCKHGAMDWLTSALANVGRMAFTNYLMQTLICSIIFFGWGFGLFGELTRRQLVPIVLGIWAFQIVFSTLWLSRFRFGPMEWLWRSLTYLRPQAMARR